MGSICLVHLPFEVVESRHDDESGSKDHNSMSLRCVFYVSPLCLTPKSSPSLPADLSKLPRQFVIVMYDRTLSLSCCAYTHTHHRDCFQRALVVNWYCLVDPTQAECFSIFHLHLSSPAYNTTAQFPARSLHSLILQNVGHVTSVSS